MSDALDTILNVWKAGLKTAIQETATPGKDGLSGPPGPIGATGPIGSTGLQGITGSEGPVGPTGLQGSQGISGKDGIPGKDGINGKDGRDGVTGRDGKNGLPGKDGFSSTATGTVIITDQLFNPVSFGAKPNVATPTAADANTRAFRDCQKKYGKIDAPPGEFFFSQDIRVVSNLKVNGAGIDTTILSVLPNNIEIENRGKNDEWFSLFNTNTAASGRIGDVTGLPYGDSNNVEISNLTINGNYNKQNLDSKGRFNTTIQSIFLQGSNNKVRNVKSIGCARGVGGGECFQIRLTFGPDTVGSKGGEVTGCEVGDVGFCGPTHFGGGGYEISCITVSGYKDKKAYGVKIKDNVIKGISMITGKQNSSINALCCSGVDSGVISDNTVQGVDGNGFYADSWGSDGLIIKNNNFYNVWRGIFLNAYGDAYNPVSLGLNNATIESNNVYLCSETPKGILATAPFVGIMINSPTSTNQSFFNNLLITKNIIQGYGPILGAASPEPFFSRGVYVVMNNSKQYSRVRITKNIIDTPDIKPGSSYYPEPGCLSLYYSSNSDTLTPEMTFFGNENSSGKVLRAMVCKPDYTFGRWA